jgi:hypothetical protein
MSAQLYILPTGAQIKILPHADVAISLHYSAHFLTRCSSQECADEAKECADEAKADDSGEL